ncbi:SAM-dependent methyltransferase [Frankia sp. Mgl5]|uniref:SAM-dependent methyltransferase n=1 Tax=Frankia sp. Mgl5 TaxID=2933793 RepID=UPI00200EF65A|nr:SAM-dependent methyltransferase [Frankia sp. Mgl5]MCK9931037.1 SAM-dependent methyltransferase [Frankia sp. Mgl5]
MGDTEVGAAGGTSFRKSVSASVSPLDLRTDIPHPARMYDYYLGGKDNFPADREAAEQALAAFPNLRLYARQNRAFLHRAFLYRAVAHLTTTAGVSQFLDIGTGIPTNPSLHETAQRLDPAARVLYVDNDPMVLSHSRALLTSTSSEGRTAYLDADLREVDRILDAPDLHATLDLSQPVAVSLIAVLPFLADSDDPYGIVRRLLDAVPSGSYLVLTHGTADANPATQRPAALYQQHGIHLQPRSRTEVERFFDILELVEPGVQIVHRWRPDDTVPSDLTDAQVSMYGAVGRKP